MESAGEPRRRRDSAIERSLVEERADLIDQAVSLVDRSFSVGGHGEGLRMVREMLGNLDAGALRELIRSMGVEGPEEVEEPSPDDERR